MKFDRLSQAELIDFLSRDYSDYGVSTNPELPLDIQAEQLWNQLRRLSVDEVIYPYPVVDLYIAENYLGNHTRYTVGEIMNLNLQEQVSLANSLGFNPSDTHGLRERLLRILRFLGLIIDPIEIFLEPTVGEEICSGLSLTDIDNLRQVMGRQEIRCQIKVNDPDNQILSVSGIKQGELKYLLSIEEYGSINTFVQITEFSDIKGLNFLLDLGMDPNIRTDEGPILSVAIDLDDEDMVDILLEGGANPNGWVENNEIDHRDPPILMAIKDDNVNMAKKLLPIGANLDVESDGDTPLSSAIQFSPESVDLLLEWGADLNSMVENKHPLIYAAGNDYPDLISTLLSWGFNPNIQDNDGDTPLMLASRWYYLEVAEILLRWGANPDIQNNDGDTALILALQGGPKMVELLLDYGADPDIQNDYGETFPLLRETEDETDL